MSEPSALELTAVAVDHIDTWRMHAVSAIAVNDDPLPLSSLAACLVSLLRMGGSGYAESDSLIVVDTTVGLTVGMHRDRKGVCSLNS